MKPIIEKRIFSYEDLRNQLKEVDARTCTISLYGYERRDANEYEEAIIAGIDEVMDWVIAHPTYFEYGQSAGYYIVAFDADDEYIESIIF